MCDVMRWMILCDVLCCVVLFSNERCFDYCVSFFTRYLMCSLIYIVNWLVVWLDIYVLTDYLAGMLAFLESCLISSPLEVEMTYGSFLFFFLLLILLYRIYLLPK